MILPVTAPSAELPTVTVIFVNAANPGALGVKVIVSPAADQLKVPPMAGLVAKADCTLFASIGSLNCSTTDEAVEMPEAA